MDYNVMGIVGLIGFRYIAYTAYFSSAFVRWRRRMNIVMDLAAVCGLLIVSSYF